MSYDEKMGVSPIDFTPEEERQEPEGAGDGLREVEDEYYDLPVSMRARTRIWSVISLALAILSALLCPIWQAGIILGVLSIGLALLSRYLLGFFDGIALWGLIIGIFGCVFCLSSMVFDLTGALDALFADK